MFDMYLVCWIIYRPPWSLCSYKFYGVKSCSFNIYILVSLYSFHCSHNCTTTTIFIIAPPSSHTRSVMKWDEFPIQPVHLTTFISWIIEKRPPCYSSHAFVYPGLSCLSFRVLGTPPFIPSVVEDPFSKWLNYWWNSYDAGVQSGGLWKTHKPDCIDHCLRIFWSYFR